MSATKFKPLISDAMLRRVYDNMLRARLFDERIDATRKLARILAGQQLEAIFASFLDAFKSRDLAIVRQDQPIAALTQGQSMETILGGLLTKDTASSHALFSTHKDIVSFIGPASEMATFAAGAARALQNEDAGRRGTQPVVLVAIGNVADQSEIDAALRAMGRGNLPLILICETRGGFRLTGTREKTHGVPHIPVDARDAVALLRCAQESFTRVRTGLGSILIEARIVPGSHDPMLAIEDSMRRRNIFHEEIAIQIQRSVTKQLDRAFKAI